MSIKYPITNSFKFAFEGVKKSLKDEPNLRIHISIAVLIIILAFLLRFTYLELAILTLTIGFVLILELINTALEALTDLVSPKIKPKAKEAKDVSAAAVLFSAILSIIVGILLFLPRIIAFF